MLDSFLISVAEQAGDWLGILAQAAGDAAGEAAGGADAPVGDGAAAGGGAAGGGGADKPAAPNFLQALIQNPLTLFAGLMFLFYAMVLLPERRKQAANTRKRAALKKNDRVITSGGIYGTVVAATTDSDEVTLRVDESNNTRIRVTRAAIASVLSSDKEKKDDAVS